MKIEIWNDIWFVMETDNIEVLADYDGKFTDVIFNNPCGKSVIWNVNDGWSEAV